MSLFFCRSSGEIFSWPQNRTATAHKTTQGRSGPREERFRANFLPADTFDRCVPGRAAALTRPSPMKATFGRGVQSILESLGASKEIQVQVGTVYVISGSVDM